MAAEWKTIGSQYFGSVTKYWKTCLSLTGSENITRQFNSSFSGHYESVVSGLFLLAPGLLSHGLVQALASRVPLGEATLNWIEHKMIRPVFKDPRAHFALVRASRSCPPLRAEAYEAEKLDVQLDQQARLFLGDSNRNSFDLAAKRANLSKIFDWYSKDFGGSAEHVLTAIAKFLPSPIGDSITSNPGAWKIQYQHYDWSLNETPNR